MHKILDIRNKNKYIYSYGLYTLLFFAIGSFLIISSVINIISINNHNIFNNKLISNLNIHKDFVINQLQDNNGHISKEKSVDIDTVVGKVMNSSKAEFEIDSKSKKEKFIISLIPLIAKENEKIRANRERLIEVKDFLLTYKTLNNDDQNFLKNLSTEYKVRTKNKHKIDIINLLILSVDEIPNSLVLAQAANESGWGTSRFAKEYNALFGEYTFDEESGVVPQDRNEGSNHLVKFFPTVNKSIQSYFRNLNTHLAYKDFRLKRQELRNQNLDLDSMALVQYLDSYAEDKNYVSIIKSIIKINKLKKFDYIKKITTKS